MSIVFENVHYIYGRDSQYPVHALNGVSVEIHPHEYIGLIGHTGSGKSTFVQHMNGLYLPSEGRVIVDGVETSDSKADLRAIRQKVGLVFQYPEDQLFEDTIYKDIAFGPKNLQLDEAEIDRRVRYAMEAVGMDFARYRDVSPFELSGGQKRRVAIAGVLALEPSYLVLDEPTAGLDPRGRREILHHLRHIYTMNPNLTLILVTHSMEDIAQEANRILVIDQGQIVMDDAPKAVFTRSEELESRGLTAPQITQAMRQLKDRGWDVDPSALNVQEALASVLKAWRGGVYE